MRKCPTCRYSAPGLVQIQQDDLIHEVPAGFCKAPGSIQSMSSNSSSFPVIGEDSWCYGHRIGWRKLARRLWAKLRPKRDDDSV